MGRFTIAFLAMAVGGGHCQTTLDLGRQGRNVDFSRSGMTKPFKAGVDLPATCSVGETFFKTDSAPGRNFYGCTAQNAWTLQGGGSAVTATFPNAETGGTALNKLAKLTASAQAVTVETADTEGAIGIVTGGAGTSGPAQVAVEGPAPCVFDNGTTVGNYVQISATIAGGCHDAGPVKPSRGQIVGRVLTTNAGAGLYSVMLNVMPSSDFSELTGIFKWTRITDKQAAISPGGFRFAKRMTPIQDQGFITISGNATGTVWLYAVQSGSVVAAHNLGPGNLDISGRGYVVDAVTADFPTGSIPLYQCAVNSGAWGECVDKRVPYGADPLVAGGTGALTTDCSQGNGCTVDIVPAIVPTKAAVNDFTGLNTFARLKLPSGPGLTGTDCDEESEAGRVFVSTSAPANQQLYICAGTAGWKLSGGAGSGSVTSVGVAAPPEFTVTGSPVTAAGVVTLEKAPQGANAVYAGPASGTTPAAPGFRLLTAADLPFHVHTDGGLTTHASTHQHGGSDEVATATAAANAIPKALGDGRLSGNWSWTYLGAEGYFAPWGLAQADTSGGFGPSTQIYAQQFVVPVAITISKVTFWNNGGNGTAKAAFAIYSSLTSKLAETPAVSLLTGDVAQSAAFASAITLQPGRYWMALVSDAGPVWNVFTWNVASRKTINKNGDRFGSCSNPANLAGTPVFPAACGTFTRTNSNYSFPVVILEP